MKKTFFASMVAVFCLLPVWASEPGEPLSIEDWEILVPGIYAGANPRFAGGWPLSFRSHTD